MKYDNSPEIVPSLDTIDLSKAKVPKAIEMSIENLVQAIYGEKVKPKEFAEKVGIPINKVLDAMEAIERGAYARKINFKNLELSA